MDKASVDYCHKSSGPQWDYGEIEAIRAADTHCHDCASRAKIDANVICEFHYCMGAFLAEQSLDGVTWDKLNFGALYSIPEFANCHLIRNTEVIKFEFANVPGMGIPYKNRFFRITPKNCHLNQCGFRVINTLTKLELLSPAGMDWLTTPGTQD